VSDKFNGQVATLLRALDRRAALFGPDAEMFGDPGWTILLEVYRARGQGRPISASDAAHVSRAPMSTGLRYLLCLEEKGYLRREIDATDRRRSHIRLTEHAINLIEAWLSVPA
jgi:DNA-binding MarR family transcriptional regulator